MVTVVQIKVVIWLKKKEKRKQKKVTLILNK